MKLKKFTPKKNRAQAMVEFAIALPILLMLLYGLLEAGRLLFLYSTIVTASRQAVRYGSATGIGTGTVPRYQDCAGIRAAAQKVDFLNAFDDEDIEIRYDTGPGTPQTLYCSLPLTSDSFTPSNSSRIEVKIKGNFFPIIPKLVPFIERSVANNDPILGISRRTILVSIIIAVTNTPDLSPSTPTNTSAPTATNTSPPTDTATTAPTNTPLVSDTPSLTPTATLSPTATLTPTPSLTPTITNTPTITFTPTLSPTPVAGCNQITHGSIAFSGTSMSMTITNPLGAPIEIKDIFVVWNHDKGHLGIAGDRPLRLVSVSWENQIWTGTSPGPSITIVPSPTTYIQPGTSTLTFTFDQSYDKVDHSEEILISLVPSGCTGFPIHATN